LPRCTKVRISNVTSFGVVVGSLAIRAVSYPDNEYYIECKPAVSRIVESTGTDGAGFHGKARSDYCRRLLRACARRTRIFEDTRVFGIEIPPAAPFAYERKPRAIVNPEIRTTSDHLLRFASFFFHIRCLSPRPRESSGALSVVVVTRICGATVCITEYRATETGWGRSGEGGERRAERGGSESGDP